MAIDIYLLASVVKIAVDLLVDLVQHVVSGSRLSRLSSVLVVSEETAADAGPLPHLASSRLHPPPGHLPETQTEDPVQIQSAQIFCSCDHPFNALIFTMTLYVNHEKQQRTVYYTRFVFSILKCRTL